MMQAPLLNSSVFQLYWQCLYFSSYNPGINKNTLQSQRLYICFFFNHLICFYISPLPYLLKTIPFLYFAVLCSLQLQPAQQQPHLFSPCPTVRHHPNGWIPPLWRSLVIWRNWNSLPRPSNRGVSNWASHRWVYEWTDWSSQIQWLLDQHFHIFLNTFFLKTILCQ